MTDERFLWRPAKITHSGTGELGWVIIRELPDGTFQAHAREPGLLAAPACCVLRETADVIAHRLNRELLRAEDAETRRAAGVDNQDQKL